MESLVLLIFTILLFISGLVSSANDQIKYIGCFDIGYSLRMDYHHHILAVTLDSCVDYCRNIDTHYAGVEKSDNFCYCGSDIVEGSTSREDGLCNVPCSYSDTRTCGGDWIMSVYEINVTDTSVVVNEQLEFLVGISVGVRLYNSSNLNTFDTVVTTGDWVHALDYHFAMKTLYIYSRGKLYKAELESKDSPLLMVKVLSICQGFAVEWVNNRIFWMNCTADSSSLVSMDLDGNSMTTILQRPGEPPSVKRMEVDPYKGQVFWIADYIIESCTTTGEYYQTNMSAPGVSVRALTLDLQARRVYYMGNLNESSSLFSMDYVGGSPREHISLPQMQSVYGLGLLAGKLYWVNYANVKDVLYSAPVDLDKPGSVKTLKTIEKAVWHMKVLHKDVQQRPGEDPCKKLTHTCSHICVSNATSAHCSCPKGMQLNLDEMTCSGSPDYISTTTSTPDHEHKTALGKPFKYVGCFDLGHITSENIMLVSRLMFNITLQKCVDYCEGMTRTYSGVSANTCFCATEIVDDSSKTMDYLCNIPCREETHLTCGGEDLLSLYEIQGNTTVVEDSNVRFLVSHNAGVVQYNASAVDTANVLMMTVNWTFTIDCHIRKNLLFSYSGGKIFKATLEPKSSIISAAPTLVKDVSDCYGFTVDWVEDKIYWMDCNITRNTLKVMDLDGGSLETVMVRPLETDRIKRMEIDPYKRIVFWIASGMIESFSLNDGEFHSNVSGAASSVGALALDLEAQRVFYVGKWENDDNIALMSVDYEGRAHRKHLSSERMRSVYGLGLYNGHVYWVNYAGMRDVILRAPLSLSGNDSVRALKTINTAVWHFKLVHPELQLRPRGNPCEHKGCSHSCKRPSFYSAVCTCPSGMTLDANGRTCSGFRITPGIVMLSLLVVLAVVLIAVGMVYLTDKYWSHLQPKIFNVPYTRTRSGREREGTITPVYDTDQDNVNLI